MPEANAIWVCEPPSERSLSRRLRNIGLMARRLRNAAAIEAALADLRPAGVVVSSRLGAELDACLVMLGPLLDDAHTTVIAGGPHPSEGMRDRLRDAGISLACFEPIDDASLRFQVNRAFLGHRHDGKARCELRAPMGWSIRIRQGSRYKEGELYDLSNGGAFIETTRPSVPGARLELELPLADGGIAVPGQVIHANVPGNLRKPRAPIGMGVRFDSLIPDAERHISRTVHTRCAELLV